MKKIFGIILILSLIVASKGIVTENKSVKDIEILRIHEEVDKAETVQIIEVENLVNLSQEIEEEKVEEDNKTEELVNTIKISLVGDILLDGGIRNHIHKHGYDYPWHYVREYFQNDDITIGNLETSITRGGEKWPNKQFNFRCSFTC